MKKLLFLSAVIFVLISSCRTEKDNPFEQTVIVEVFWVDSLGVKVESAVSMVLLFEYADFDFKVSFGTILSGLMTLVSGEWVESKYYNIQEGSHIHTLERVEDGKYCIAVWCGDSGRIQIRNNMVQVNRDMHNVPIRFTLTHDDRIWY